LSLMFLYTALLSIPAGSYSFTTDDSFLLPFCRVSSSNGFAP
jgi:hypothetical protein